MYLHKKLFQILNTLEFDNQRGKEELKELIKVIKDNNPFLEI